ncbi:MAG TPA: PAS domain S-box protein [Syntrophorhabdaceae bacterium]|nr:PAS domain S-box protein [Syntrophorhabdaceae bacterium]
MTGIRKSAGTNQKKGKNQFEFILNNIVDAVYKRDLRTDRYEYMSPAIERIVGFSSNEMTDMDFDTLVKHIHPEDNAAVEREMMMRREEGYIIYRFLMKSGEYRWISDNFRHMRDQNGEFIYRIGIIRDISGRKKVEERLRASEKHYRELVQGVNGAILCWDKDGTITFMNDFGLALFGYSYEEIVGKHVKTLLPERDPSRTDLKDLVRGFVNDADNYKSSINRNITKDGRLIWMNWTNRPIYENDQLSEILAIGSDITELKQAQETLARYAAVQKGINTILQTTLAQDKHELGLACIKICEELTESTFSLIGEVQGNEFHDIAIHNPGWEACNVTGTGVLHRSFKIHGLYGHVLTENISVLTNDPSHHPESIGLPEWHPPIDSFLGVPLIRGGITVGLIAVANRPGGYTAIQKETLETIAPAIVDALERKEAEEELKQAKEELEKRVQERTGQLDLAYKGLQEGLKEREIMEDRLRQSQKMEAVGTLAGGIAHDFNNILVGIIGFGEMIEENLPPGSKQAEHMKRVLNAALRGRDLVRKILAFSRKTDAKREQLHLSEVIDETVQLLRPSLPSTIEIKVSNNSANDLVMASSTELQQVIMNLATNAAFSMRREGGVLSISTENIYVTDESRKFYGNEVESGECIQLSISDTGEGIPTEIQGRIFEPFFSTKSSGEGTGMGLAVVYGIVKDLRGSIVVKSKVNEGTTFDIVIPTVKTSTAPEREKGAKELKGGTERILFVDDEDLITEWAESALVRLGYKVTVLNDAPAAFETFQSDPSAFDLAILDQTMPNLSGYNLAREMMKIRAGFPVILCTGHTDAVTESAVKEAGIKKFLIKPFGKQTLAEAIRTVLDGQ